VLTCGWGAASLISSRCWPIHSTQLPRCASTQAGVLQTCFPHCIAAIVASPLCHWPALGLPSTSFILPRQPLTPFWQCLGMALGFAPQPGTRAYMLFPTYNLAAGGPNEAVRKLAAPRCSSLAQASVVGTTNAMFAPRVGVHRQCTYDAGRSRGAMLEIGRVGTACMTLRARCCKPCRSQVYAPLQTPA